MSGARQPATGPDAVHEDDAWRAGRSADFDIKGLHGSSLLPPGYAPGVEWTLLPMVTALGRSVHPQEVELSAIDMGYHARLSGVDLTLIMEQRNHDSLAYTKRYLGITDDELTAIMHKLNL